MEPWGTPNPLYNTVRLGYLFTYFTFQFSFEAFSTRIMPTGD